MSGWDVVIVIVASIAGGVVAMLGAWALMH